MFTSWVPTYWFAGQASARVAATAIEEQMTTELRQTLEARRTGCQVAEHVISIHAYVNAYLVLFSLMFWLSQMVATSCLGTLEL